MQTGTVRSVLVCAAQCRERAEERGLFFFKCFVILLFDTQTHHKENWMEKTKKKRTMQTKRKRKKKQEREREKKMTAAQKQKEKAARKRKLDGEDQKKEDNAN
eukprot:TRINITY_DN1259_c4_g1_i2.p2 TRINITY_DN1259_c4_g1~~TRINITY_DN1259_c4_g1_i2.p2  ORF type:complete len:103 (+),score=6.07 TRINITY_DN1259_c4_g1_i2:124-432(+)